METNESDVDTNKEKNTKEAGKDGPEDNMSGQNIQYAPLLQSMSSDEEDNVMVYDRLSKRNGEAHNKPHEAIQLQDLSSRAPSDPQDSVIAIRNRRKSRKTLVAIVVVCCVLVLGVFGAVVFAVFSREFNTGVVHDVKFLPYGDWSLFFNKSATESSVTLVDVDGDGLEDILVGVTTLEQYMISHHQPPSPDTMNETCAKLGFPYPCVGQVVALRGYDRKELWRTWLRGGLIFVNCDNVDVNGDKKPDCIFTGRESTVEAVDLASGQIHWVIDADNKIWSNHFVPGWNVYRALVVSDVDHDGVKDVMVTHGGNQTKEPEDHERASGRVIFLSGATGKPLGRYVDLPDSKETYMSPLSHVTANGSTYFLFGSGGETIPGDLMIVSDKVLMNSIMGNGPLSLRTIFRGAEKGVMVAPVLADLTHDGTPDILVSAFEGLLVLYDGETLQEVWRRQFPGMESYSTPTPGHFDGDGVLDFLVLWGHGVWQEYDYATVYVVSGHDGSILWQTPGRMPQMYSDLSLRMQGSHDLFLFHAFGGQKDSAAHSSDHSGHGVLSGGGRRKKRHIVGHADKDQEPELLDDSPESFRHMCQVGQHHFEDSQLTCTDKLERMKSETLLMDGAHTESPSLISSMTPEPHRYTLPVGENGRHCHHLSPVNKKLVDMCVVKTTKAVTGAVGDVDGDGEADLIQLYRLVTNTITDNYSYLSTESDLILARVSLTKALKGKPKLLPMSDQPWRQFMGSAGDNVYRSKKLNTTHSGEK